MKVIKVIVDELPKVCNCCPFMDDYFHCELSGGREVWDFKDKRPDWCPLISINELSSDESGYYWLVEMGE